MALMNCASCSSKSRCFKPRATLKSLCWRLQKEENAIIRIQQTVQAGAQADLISLERRKAQLLQLEEIRKYSEDALTSAQALIDSTNLQVEADARRRELIAEGINPALADQLVAIEQNFDAERKVVDERIAALETTLLQADADAEVTKELKKQLDLLKKKRGELDRSEGDAKTTPRTRKTPARSRNTSNSLKPIWLILRAWWSALLKRLSQNLVLR